MSAPRIWVLCGAHKTASTHFQRILTSQPGRLARAGTVVIPPKVVRREIMPLVDRARGIAFPARIKAELADTLARLAPGAGRILICDENLLGGTEPRMLLRGGALYPWGPARVGRLLSLLPPAEVRVALALRSMATFLPSAYAENLFHFPYVTFDAFLEDADPAALSWHDLLVRMREETDAKVTLWRYEDYPAVAPAALGALLGRGVAADLEIPSQPARVGLSAEAIEEVARADGKGNPVPKLGALKKTFPKGSRFHAFQPFATANARALEDIYCADMAKIWAMSGVQVLQP
ncbi:MAG: hypothetical protein AAF092_09985 [Pseudomonadota bacterium]